MFSVPHQLAAEDLAHVLTECTDSAEAKEEHEEGSSEDSDSEDNVPFTPVVDGFMDVPTAPVVDGLEAKRLATLYMRTEKRELLQVVIAREDRGTRSYHFHAILG